MSKPIHCIEKDSFRWIYEDELPEEMTDKEYDEWFKKSHVVYGVRMGPDPTWINKRRIKMGREYEIRYFIPDTGEHHFADADDLETALLFMKECKKKTKSKCITLIWRS